MGNNGSRSGNVAQRLPIEPEQQWAHSFPRNPHRVYQHKVLPEKEIGTKLRCTNNGEILQSGGTISGRHHQQTLSLEREDKSFRIFRASSITSNSPDEYNQREEKTPNRSYVSRHRGVHKYAAKRYENNNNNNVQRERMKKFGSEPDLRNPTVANHQNVVDKYKGKRKYKAPPPPNTLTVRSDPDGAVSSINSSPILISSEYKNMKYKCENLMSVSRGKNSPISDSSDESTKKAPMTQILSEYRQEQRDYKDFRGSPRYKGKFCDSQFFRQVTTIHPQITCDMPKASTHKTDSESSANYRKQFAHGVKTNKYENGACSDDSQSNIKNYSPKMYNNKHKPISR